MHSNPFRNHRNLALRWIAISGIAISSLNGILADDDDFFSLPSPSEILNEAESEGLIVKLSPKSVSVLKWDLKTLATTQPELACFGMGKVFAIAGYGLKDLNNKVILQLAQKVLSTAQALDLPPVISEEIDRFYRLMVSKNSWDRQELLLSFTTARASLMYLLKGTSKVPEEDQARLARFGAALECGLWYQSLDLALENLKPDQLEAFKTVYMDPDYLNYFQKMLQKITPDKSKILFEELNAVNNACLNAMKDDIISAEEVVALQKALTEVMSHE